MSLTRDERDEIRKRADGLIRLAAYDSSGSGKRRRAIADDALALLDALDEAGATITGLRGALEGMVACGGCGHPRHVPNDECWWQDRSECAYAQGRGSCSFDCTTEPSCMTDTPREGWPLANAQAALARPEFPDTERPTNA